jgi:hypothetical protein
VVFPSGSYTNQKQPFRRPAGNAAPCPPLTPSPSPPAPCTEAQQILQNRASQEPFSLRAAFLERNFNRPPYRQCTALNGDG